MRRALLLLACVAVGCRPVAPCSDPTGPPRLGAPDALHGWRLSGELRGPLSAWGPRVGVEAWLRADGWLRAELDFTRLDPPRRETLLWSEDVALWVESPSGRIRPLGDAPGELEVEGGTFRLEHVVWLLAGAVPGGESGLRWSRESGQWRGRSARVGLRRSRDGGWTEVAWRDGADIGHLRATVEATDGGGFPLRLGLTGSPWEGRAVLAWDVQIVDVMEDTIFDPLWRP